MRTTKRSWRTLAVFALGTVPLVAGNLVGSADGPVDSDIFIFEATAGTASLGPGPASGTYTLDASRCFTEPLPVAPPSPLPSSIPGYLDVIPDESGPCTSVTGTGTYTDLIACSTGLMTMSWNFTEPSGDVVHLEATGAVVGGVIVGASLPGGYKDDGAANGTAVITGLVLAAPTPICNGVQALSFTAVVDGIY